jgi:hypothetical protein
MYTYYIVKQANPAFWLTILAVILGLWGIYFSIWGFEIFVSFGILPANNLLAWVSAIYGSMMIGLGVVVFGVGRIAIRNKDIETLKALWLCLAVWLLLEAVFSVYLQVWFNVAVDFAVLGLFSLVLLRFSRQIQNS